jgi:hypothetical protein
MLTGGLHLSVVKRKRNRKGKVNGSGVFGWAARVGPDRLVRSDFFPFFSSFFYSFLFSSILYNFCIKASNKVKQISKIRYNLTLHLKQ